MRRLDEYRRLLNNSDVSRWLLHVPWPYVRADAHAHVLRARRNRRAGTDLALAIIEPGSDRLIGGIGLHRIDLEHRHAEIGYWLGQPFWGQGYGSEAVESLLRVGFEELRLHRIGAGLFRGNARSQHVLEKAGFLAEGHRREVFFKRGAWKDELWFGLLESEWRRGRSTPIRTVRAGPRP
jgi:[ribosomal protein S5]-alanine N-acetyltransferase